MNLKWEEVAFVLGEGHLIFRVFAFYLGACLGSFLSAMAWRIPHGISIAYPPSSCPVCQKKIKSLDNLPILSYLILKGRCRFCQASIHISYLFLEIFCGVLSLYFFMHYGETQGNFILALSTFSFTLWMLLLSVTDFRFRRLPDALILLPLFAYALNLLFDVGQKTPTLSFPYGVGFCFLLFLPWLFLSFIFRFVWLILGQESTEKVEGFFIRTHLIQEESGFKLVGLLVFALPFGLLVLFLQPDLSNPRWLFAVTGSFLGGGMLLSVGWISSLIAGKEALGQGDIKLAFMLGFIFGPWNILALLLIATLSGFTYGIFTRILFKSRSIPFGPFLALGAILCCLLDMGGLLDYALG